MGLNDILNASKIKQENDNLKRLLTPEMQNAMNLQAYIEELRATFLELNNRINN